MCAICENKINLRKLGWGTPRRHMGRPRKQAYGLKVVNTMWRTRGHCAFRIHELEDGTFTADGFALTSLPFVHVKPKKTREEAVRDLILQSIREHELKLVAWREALARLEKNPIR